MAVDDEDEGPAEHGGHDGGRDGSEAGLEPVDFIKDSDSELWMGEVIPGSGVVDDGEHSCAIKEECEKADTSHNGALAECEAEPSSSARPAHAWTLIWQSCLLELAGFHFQLPSRVALQFCRTCCRDFLVSLLYW